MDLNELRGKVLRVNLARPSKIPVQGMGNKASTLRVPARTHVVPLTSFLRLVWESEEWLKQYAKPLARSGGMSQCCPRRRPAADRGSPPGAALRAQAMGQSPATGDEAPANGDEDAAMQEQ